MDATCPNCNETVDVGDDEHYKLVKCPKCDSEFQAFSENTQKLTRDFLDQVLKRTEPPED